MRTPFACAGLSLVVLSLAAGSPARAQQRGATPAPALTEALRAERREEPRPAPARHEGEGPFPKLIIRGATLIDGTGGRPRGPVDTAIEGSRTSQLTGAGDPGGPSGRA